MGTRSAIIEKTDTGYRGIYCHWDGYLENNGKILNEHYQDAAKVSSLIDLGDISSLGERVNPLGKHSFDDREDGTTSAYMRDRGEADCEPKIGTLEGVIDAIDDDGYVYIFHDGTWYVREGDDPEILLSDALVKLEKEKV